jgi:hypothetical protein
VEERKSVEGWGCRRRRIEGKNKKKIIGKEEGRKRRCNRSRRNRKLKKGMKGGWTTVKRKEKI